MAKLGFAWEMEGAHYEAEHAATGRSACKHCKEKFPQGALRIGVKVTEGDQWGSSMGFYHPKCLPKTFPPHACGFHNKKIDNPAKDITNFSSLSTEDQAAIRAGLAEGAAPAAPVAPTTSDGKPRIPKEALKGHERLELRPAADGATAVSGSGTFATKDVLRHIGGKWNGALKAWLFTDDTKLRELLEIPPSTTELSCDVLLGKIGTQQLHVIPCHAAPKAPAESEAAGSPPKRKARTEY